MKYILSPLVGWLAAGSLKFFLNYLRLGSKLAIEKIGNGGFPSTHTTIISTSVMVIGFNEGFQGPLFGLGEAVLLIVIIDALGLRNAVGKQAKVINDHCGDTFLRESMGHTVFEVIGGLVLGGIIANLITGIW